MKSIIETYKRKLTWPIIQATSSSTYYCETDPVNKQHTLYIPTHPDEFADVQLFHEIVHLLFAEKYHYLFSTSYFARGTPQYLLQITAPIFRAAQDWFINAVVYREMPEEAKKEAEVTLKMLLPTLMSPQLLPVVTGGLAVAELKRYANLDISHPLLSSVASAFLAVDPDTPTLGNLRALVNELLGLIRINGKRMKVEIVAEGIEVWKFAEG